MKSYSWQTENRYNSTRGALGCLGLRILYIAGPQSAGIPDSCVPTTRTAEEVAALGWAQMDHLNLTN